MQNTEVHEDKILDKVRALLAKAESSKFEAEADAFRAKAIELMAKYEIDEAAISMNSASGPRPIVMVSRYAEEPYATAKLNLWFEVSMAFGIRTIAVKNDRGKRGFKCYEQFGTQQAHDLTEFLVTSLLLQGSNGLSDIKASVGPRSCYEPSTRAMRLGYLQGFFDRTSSRVREAHRTAVATAANFVPGSGLVLVNDAKRTDDFIAEKYGRLRSGSSRATYRNGGYAAGRAAGNNADIGLARVGGNHRAIGA